MLTISCIPSSFCAFNIINRKMAGGDVGGGYSNPLSLGISPLFFSYLFGVYVYIVASDAFALGLLGGAQAGDAALGDVAVRTCVFSSDVTSSTCILFADN